MERLVLHRTLRLDGWACMLLGAALIVGARPLAGPAGLGATWPLWALGAALAVYGLDNVLLSRRPTRLVGRVLAGVDLAFALTVGTVAVVDPTNAAAGVRGGLLVLALVSAVMGAAKLAGAARLDAERAPAVAAAR